MIDPIGQLNDILGRQYLYKNILYVDANPAVGADTNGGSREFPFLTIQAAVTAAPEYTTIVCVDSRVGAAAVGFDENATINGVVIDRNHITLLGCKIAGDRCVSADMPINNSIANADHIFSGSGRGVGICGFQGVLPNVNGDEEVIHLTGDGVTVLDCDIVNPIGTPGFRGIHLTGDDCHARRCHIRVFDDDGITLDGCVMSHVEECVLGDCLVGIHVLDQSLGCVLEHCDIFGCTTGIETDAPGVTGALWTNVCSPHFHNNTNDWVNNGGVTNVLIDAHTGSQIVAGQTVEEELEEIYDRIGAPALASVSADIAAIEAKLDAGGLGVGLVTKALTFANQIGQVALFTVTGDVIVRIVAIVKTNCGTGTACNVSVGIAALVDALIPVTDITTLAAEEIWWDAAPDSEIEAFGTIRQYIISDGNDITLNSSAADNSGAITFYCFWTPLSAGAGVVAA